MMITYPGGGTQIFLENKPWDKFFESTKAFVRIRSNE